MDQKTAHVWEKWTLKKTLNTWEKILLKLLIMLHKRPSINKYISRSVWVSFLKPPVRPNSSFLMNLVSKGQLFCSWRSYSFTSTGTLGWNALYLSFFVYFAHFSCFPANSFRLRNEEKNEIFHTISCTLQFLNHNVILWVEISYRTPKIVHFAKM